MAHLNYGKIQMLTKMVHGYGKFLTIGVCEWFVLSKHHREKLDKGKAWCAKAPLQLIHSDICDPLEVPSISHAVYFLPLLMTLVENLGFIFWKIKVKHL